MLANLSWICNYSDEINNSLSLCDLAPILAYGILIVLWLKMLLSNEVRDFGR